MNAKLFTTLLIVALLGITCIIIGCVSARADSQLYADVSLSDRNDFTGEFRAYTSNDVNVTAVAHVYFKLQVGAGELYQDDFGDDPLTPVQVEQFQDASEYNNIRCSDSENVAYVKLKIGTTWRRYDLE